jgi:hypothetical protein
MSKPKKNNFSASTRYGPGQSLGAGGSGNAPRRPLGTMEGLSGSYLYNVYFAAVPVLTHGPHLLKSIDKEQDVPCASGS